MKNSKKIIDKFLKTICFTSIVLIMLINAIYVLMKNLDITYVLTIGNLSFYTNKTDSMFPTITQRDLLIIKRNKKYKENDIIIFQQNSDIKTMRIMKNVGNNIQDEFMVKGDYNFYIEPYGIKEEQIEGKVIKTIKNMGFFLDIIQSKVLLIVNTGILMFIIYYRIKFIKRMKKRKKIYKKTIKA